MFRATAIAERSREDAAVESWIAAQRRRYWRWAGHVARCSDGRWTHKILDWRPANGFRYRGRPLKRWSDDADAFFASIGYGRGAWREVAQQREFWKQLENDFGYEVGVVVE